MRLATEVDPSLLAEQLQRCQGDIREAAARLQVSASGLRNRALQLGLLRCGNT